MCILVGEVDIYYYMNQPIHILGQMGVMTSFSVSKKITETDVCKYLSKQKNSGKCQEEINNMLKHHILTEMQDEIQNNNIPGLLSPLEIVKTVGVNQKIDERIPELNRLLMIMVHKMAEKKYNKMSLCYFINCLVNMLGVTQDDFAKFHFQNNKDDDDDDDDDDESNQFKNA